MRAGPGRDHAEIHYWRKHPDLHVWMENLYREKGDRPKASTASPFSLEETEGGGSESRVSITPEKTRHACRFQSAGKLDAAIKAALLPHTTGFFLGASDGTEYADDLAFIRDARRQPP
jgi:hypothetical protein